MYINVYMTYLSTPHTPTLSSSPPPPLPHHPLNTPHIPIPNIHPPPSRHSPHPPSPPPSLN